MRRIDNVKKTLNIIIDSYESKDIYRLLFYLQDLDIMYGYAVAMLQAFEDSKIGVRTSQEISEIMRNGVYDRLFDEWLNQEMGVK